MAALVAYSSFCCSWIPCKSGSPMTCAPSHHRCTEWSKHEQRIPPKLGIQSPFVFLHSASKTQSRTHSHLSFCQWSWRQRLNLPRSIWSSVNPNRTRNHSLKVFLTITS
jgi:hypothetical protein